MRRLVPERRHAAELLPDRNQIVRIPHWQRAWDGV
jgi:hypothetical protein